MYYLFPNLHYNFLFNVSLQLSFKILSMRFLITENHFYTVRPYINPFAFEENTYAGEIVQLYCFASRGDTPLKISWSFHGEELSSHMGMSTSRIGDRTSLLTINPVMAAHSGNYTCTAENSAGVAEYTSTLFVSG